MNVGPYVLDGIIGRGSFGTVYKCDNLAVKVISKSVLFNQEDRKRILREVNILRNISHPNIVCFIDIIVTNTDVCLVMERVEQELTALLNKNIGEDMVKSILFQTLTALSYLHSNGIVHRDIKPANILIDTTTNIVKLCDFGLASYNNNHKSIVEYVASRWYRPPEIFFGWKTGSSFDIWSLACTIIELLNSQPLFASKSRTPPFDLLRGSTFHEPMNIMLSFEKKPEVTTIRHLLRNDTSYLLTNLLGDMLRYDPTKRITSLNALKHVYFDDLTPIAATSSVPRLPNEWENRLVTAEEAVFLLLKKSTQPLKIKTDFFLEHYETLSTARSASSYVWKKSFEQWSVENIPSAEVLSPPLLESSDDSY